nr:hypothetical protein [Tanacetum cinerariifolium]
DGSNNPPPPNSKVEESPPTSPIIPDADGQSITPIAAFGQNFHFTLSPFVGMKGVGLIRWIKKTKMVFTVATTGMEVVTRKTWAEMKVMMTEEFCPPEVIQRREKNIKGEVTSFEPATLSKAMRMAHTLMEQKVKAKAEREADNKKR